MSTINLSAIADINRQKHLTENEKMAISTIIGEWETYLECKREAEKLGKRHLTLNKLFEKETGVKMPYLCWWDTQQEMLSQLNIT